jgi:DNA-binding LacI/PurR family transcriptional regulator
VEGIRLNMTKAFYRWHYKHGLPLGKEQLMTYEDVNVKDPQCLWDWLKKYQITAIFFSHDFNAIRAINYFQEIGIDLLSKVSIVGFDDIPDAAKYGLTTVQQDIHQIIEEAFRLLLAMDYHREGVVKIPAKCIFRSSTRPPEEIIKD